MSQARNRSSVSSTISRSLTLVDKDERRTATNTGGQQTETVAGETTERGFTPEAQRARFLELAKDPATVAGGRAMMRRLGDINANRIPEPTREDEQPAEADEQPAAAFG